MSRRCPRSSFTGRRGRTRRRDRGSRRCSRSRAIDQLCAFSPELSIVPACPRSLPYSCPRSRVVDDSDRAAEQARLRPAASRSCFHVPGFFSAHSEERLNRWRSTRLGRESASDAGPISHVMGHPADERKSGGPRRADDDTDGGLDVEPSPSWFDRLRVDCALHGLVPMLASRKPTSRDAISARLKSYPNTPGG